MNEQDMPDIQRPVATQLERIEQGLDMILQVIAASDAIYRQQTTEYQARMIKIDERTPLIDESIEREKRIDACVAGLAERLGAIQTDFQKELKIRLEGIQQQIEKLGAKLNSWLAEEAIAADILKKTRELQKHNAKHDHTPAMRERAALRLAKRGVGTNRGSK